VFPWGLGKRQVLRGNPFALAPVAWVGLWQGVQQRWDVRAGKMQRSDMRDFANQLAATFDDEGFTAVAYSVE